MTRQKYGRFKDILKVIANTMGPLSSGAKWSFTKIIKVDLFSALWLLGSLSKKGWVWAWTLEEIPETYWIFPIIPYGVVTTRVHAKTKSTIVTNDLMIEM